MWASSRSGEGPGRGARCTLALDQALLTLLMLVIVVPSKGCGPRPVLSEAVNNAGSGPSPFFWDEVKAVCTVCVQGDTMAASILRTGG